MVSCHGLFQNVLLDCPCIVETEEEIYQQINHWWNSNKRDARGSLLFAYSLGKAQRVLAGLDPSIGPIYAHSAVHSFLEHYRNAGVYLPKVKRWRRKGFSDAMIIAPPAVEDSMGGRFTGVRKGFASGWMAIRGPAVEKIWIVVCFVRPCGLAWSN